MKFTCERSALHEGLKVVNRALSDRSTLPVLHNVLITPQDDGVVLSATDLELGMRMHIPATVTDPAPLCLPAKTLFDFVNTLSDGEVTVVVGDKNSGKITKGKTEFKILGLSPDEFPPLPEIQEAGSAFCVPEARLHRLIRSVAFAVSTDDTRPILTAVHLQYLMGGKSGPTLKFAATDTHRLAVRSVKIEDGNEVEGSCLVPLRTLAELLKSLKADGEAPVAVKLDKSQIEFTTASGLTMVSRLIEGQFPKFERVIPKEFTAEFSVSVAELLPVIQRSAIVAKENSNKVWLTVKPGEGVVVVSSKAGDVGEMEDEIQVAWKGESEEEHTFIVNFKFLLDVLTLKEDDTARFEVNQGVQPMVFRPSEKADYLVVIMPMQKDS